MNVLTLITFFSASTLWISTNGCSSRGYSAKSGQDLQALLDKASPGETILLEPIDYSGDFILPDKGSSSPITLKGTNTNRKSTTILGSTTALEIKGGSWILSNLAVGSGQQGIVIKGSNHVLNSVSITGVNLGVIINGNSNKLNSISISKTDQGVIVRGNSNELEHISCSGQRSIAVNVESGDGNFIRSLSVNDAPKYSLLLQEKTCCGDMQSLSLGGLLEVRGRSYTFKSLSSSDAGAVNVLGCDNSFSSSSIRQIFLTNECRNNMDRSNNIRKYLDSPFKI